MFNEKKNNKTEKKVTFIKIFCFKITRLNKWFYGTLKMGKY